MLISQALVYIKILFLTPLHALLFLSRYSSLFLRNMLMPRAVKALTIYFNFFGLFLTLYDSNVCKLYY